MDYPGKIIRKTAVTPSQTSAPGVWTLEDAAAATKTNTWPVAGVPNPISRSLRFNSADSAYLNRTPGSTTNRRTWTWSGWIKLGTIANWGGLFNAGTSGDQFAIYLYTDSTLYIQDYASSANNIQIQPTQVFRDPSAWYHIVVAIDTTQATSTNRVKVYINGSQVTAFSTSTYPSQNYDTQVNSTSFAHNVGRNFQFATSTAKYFDGYITEINFIDGQALTPSSFGMTDPQTGAWIPIKYTGTYGTNGFYLNFSDNSSTGTLGYDYSGNGNNWTSNNFSVTAGADNDSLTDVPTPWIAYNTTGDVGGVFRGNYCTLNSASPLATATVNGNLRLNYNATNCVPGTMGVTTGKWYWEGLLTTQTNSQQYFGVANASFDLSKTVGEDAYSWGMTVQSNSSNGKAQHNNVQSSSYATFGNGDICMVAYDMGTGKIWFGRNGTWFNSGAPASGTGEIYSNLSGTIVPMLANKINSGGVLQVNFGQRPFAYTPPAGFVSLCTTNLPTPTIGATSTTQANYYFDVKTWSGNSSTQTIPLNFAPDFIWNKSRSGASNHAWWDVLRGTGAVISSSTTEAETTGYNAITSFSSNAISLGPDNTGVNNGRTNETGRTYVGWVWKANGAGSSNTSGTITSTVSANTTSGFSVVTYTGNNTLAQSVGHGLGAAPSMIIVKSRSNATNWLVWHSAISINSVLLLNTTDAEITGLTGIWGSALPTSTTFGLNRLDTDNNRNGQTYVAYCFAPVAGYSAFGSYTGNASTDGPFVYTGFRPKFIFGKDSGGTNNWWIFDSVRDTYNVAGKILRPNLSDAELDSPPRVDLLSNGFKIRTTGLPNDATTYIYAAFAEFPFKFSNAR